VTGPRSATHLEPSAPLRLRLLPLSIAAIVATTIIPIKLRWPSLTFLDTAINRSDIANNLLLYLPLGVSLVGARFTCCLFTALGLSVLAELLQFGCVDRDPSPVDVASNVAGALVGFILFRAIRKLAGFSLESIKIGRPFAALCIVVAAVSVFALAWHRTRADFSNWDSSFQFAVGNELSGDRPWKGTVEKLAVFATPLEPSTIRQLAVLGPDVPVSGSKHLLPDAIYLSSGILSAPANCAQKLLADGEDLRFFETLRHASQISILVWITPRNVTQTGPARIVTYSHDIFSRNFTLGQMARALTFRLRTPNTGGNGTDPALYTAPVLSAGRQTFVAITYDGAVSKIYVDGKLAAHVNLVSRRPRFPQIVLRLLPSPLPIPDLETNICEIVIGSLVTMGLLGLLRVPSKQRGIIWRTAFIGGGVPGILIWIFCASEPSLGLRVLLLSLSGALTIAFASKRPASQTAA
jgi:Concanavalin A-like lectin/glucanases superfamily/VanZ like family